jgi:hypothetical protein
MTATNRPTSHAVLSQRILTMSGKHPMPRCLETSIPTRPSRRVSRRKGPLLRQSPLLRLRLLLATHSELCNCLPEVPNYPNHQETRMTAIVRPASQAMLNQQMRAMSCRNPLHRFPRISTAGMKGASKSASRRMRKRRPQLSQPPFLNRG